MKKSTATEADKVAQLHRLLASGRAAELRQGAGLTLAVVGRSVGVHYTAVARWEAGQRRPRGREALAYLALLERLDRAQRVAP